MRGFNLRQWRGLKGLAGRRFGRPLMDGNSWGPSMPRNRHLVFGHHRTVARSRAGAQGGEGGNHADRANVRHWRVGAAGFGSSVASDIGDDTEGRPC